MSSVHKYPAPGMVVLLYHRPSSRWFPDASTVMEHVRAFPAHSRFPVHALNVDAGFPPQLAGVDPGAIVLHYSLFGSGKYLLSEQFLDWMDESGAYKVCFFQDEYYYCGRRFEFLNEHAIDCVFTHIEPAYFSQVYGRYTNVPRLEYNLPGYVSEELLAAARRHARPAESRPIDVGYRGRPLPLYWGRGSQEKAEIGVRFAELAAGTDLVLDIDTTEEGRLYGRSWYEFVASCRYALGVESGVSLFDLEDEVRKEYTELRRGGKEPTLEELEAGALGRWDGCIPYRLIGPRHFEAAALSTCQVLFEGRYSNVMQPMVHYIALRKDFSNFDEVVQLIRDKTLRNQLVENAHRDLIASGEWSYQRLAQQLDGVLTDAGLKPKAAPSAGEALARGTLRRKVLWELRWYGRWLLWVRLKPALDRTSWFAKVRRALGRPPAVPYT